MIIILNLLFERCASALGGIVIEIRTASGGELVRFCTTMTQEPVVHVEFVPPESIECTEVGLLAVFVSSATTYSSMEIPDNHGTGKLGISIELIRPTNGREKI